MGQSMKKLATGKDDGKMEAVIGNIVEKNYAKIAKDTPNWTTADLKLADFYRAVFQTIEEINKELGGSQFRAPRVETINEAFN
ncbi:hypothetical protein BVC80_8999g7 [Macleaya cordata]|uniref:Uncharacterized protein n=1 Tax=Macleaya cordata TaxID=56857 RepID=A0A200Q5E1_MACCD|nr:hypothetical protein BVC80_8999g7 [Macleaya cordata]